MPPVLSYTAEREVLDENANYACWKLHFVDLGTLAGDPIFNVTRSKIQSRDKTAKVFVDVDFVKKQDGRILHHSIFLNPVFLQTKPAQGAAIPLKEMLAGSAGPYAGTRTAILE